MDLSGLISSFATGTYSVTRRARASIPFRRGLAQPTTDTALTITASVQPASGKDLLRLAEGRRADETRTLFTTTPLYTGDEGAAYESDWVTVDGQAWEIIHVESWAQAGGGIAYRCIAQAPKPA